MDKIYKCLNEKLSVKKPDVKKINKEKIFIFSALIFLTSSITVIISSSSLISNSHFLLLVALMLLGLLYYVLNRLYNLGSETIPYLIGLLPVILYNPYNQFMYNKCKKSFNESCYNAVAREFQSSLLFDGFPETIIKLSDKEKDIISVLKAGCLVGHRRSCFNTSISYRSSGDYSLAIMYGEKACKLKLAKSCYSVAKMYVKSGELDLGYSTLKKALNYNYKKTIGELQRDFPMLSTRKDFAKLINNYGVKLKKD